jgi:predicted alpha/beta superfamily hydrolase
MLKICALSAALLLMLVAGCSKVPAAPAESGESAGPPAYVLEDTEVRALHATSLDRDYQLFISLPASYRKDPAHRFPVIFTTDANYGFPVLRSISRRINDNGDGMEEAVVIGLSYASGDTPAYSRRRDYTPSTNGVKDAVSDMPGRAPRFGEAEAYRRFVADQIFPFVAQNYQVDMHRKVYVGHSYGGLFGAHILLTEPTMFEHYILGSPSLWFDNAVMLARARAYVRAHTDLPADVYMAVGSYETIKPGTGDKRFNTNVDMVRDARTFARILASGHFPGLKMQMEVIDGEDHLSAAPIIFTHGLTKTLPWTVKHAPG